MPIKIDNQLPAHHSLELENIFVMTETRALKQDIRPLKILILNLMPTKIETETQILRLLSNTPLQVDVELLQVTSHVSKNVSQEHMLKFYKTFDDVKNRKFDGLIVTGAPVEMLEFEQVDYWNELCAIFDWAKTNVYSTYNICWALPQIRHKKAYTARKDVRYFRASSARFISPAFKGLFRRLLRPPFKAYGNEKRGYCKGKGFADFVLFRNGGRTSYFRYGLQEFLLHRSFRI